MSKMKRIIRKMRRDENIASLREKVKRANKAKKSMEDYFSSEYREFMTEKNGFEREKLNFENLSKLGIYLFIIPEELEDSYMLIRNAEDRLTIFNDQGVPLCSFDKELAKPREKNPTTSEMRYSSSTASAPKKRSIRSPRN